MDNKSCITETLSICTHMIVITILQAWTGRAELQYSGKFQIQKRPALFRNVKSFVDCSMERSIRYKFLIVLGSIQQKLSSDHSLSTCFSRSFPYIDGPSFSPYKPLQNVHFSGGSRQNVDRVLSQKNLAKMRFLPIFIQIWKFWLGSRNLVTRSGSATAFLKGR